MATESQQSERETLLDDLEANHEDLPFEEGKAILPPPPPPAKRSTAYLDGLRGLAALCVFSGHMIGGGDHERGFGDPDGQNFLISLPFIRNLYTGAPAAVAVFFVLSGFVVTQSMVKIVRDQKEGFLRTLASALIRRPVRLYLPCWIFALIIALALHLPYEIHPPLPWLQARDSIWIELLRWREESWNYFWPFRHHGSDQPWFIYDLVVWTIPIELKGSYLCYGLVAVYALANRSFGVDSPVHLWAVGTLMVGVAALLQLGGWWPACFIAGYVWSIVEVHALDKPLLNRTFTTELGGRKWSIPATTIGITSIFWISWYLLGAPATSGKPEWSLSAPGWYWLTKMIPEYYGEAQFYRYWNSWGAIGMVYATLRLPWLQWFFNTRPLQFLGKVSFMLYLIHLPMAYCFTDRWIRVFGHVGFGSGERWYDNLLYLPDWGVKGFNLQWIACYTVALAVNLVVSYLLTRFLDEPCVRLGKYVTGLLHLNSPSKKKPILGDTP
ncbi:hypothetical protein AMS68_002914 [Peltaster fructicola]|uniref:Acyltransferase 3 domain-containing protein n=1 Tax=Peltaster fructicola TaxID=286661 RepID=A0A6H0XRK9_9PEZI|nr:hypothetical protein AMS68_002914 [Peltaster fructicola]